MSAVLNNPSEQKLIVKLKVDLFKEPTTRYLKKDTVQFLELQEPNKDTPDQRMIYIYYSNVDQPYSMSYNIDGSEFDKHFEILYNANMINGGGYKKCRKTKRKYSKKKFSK